MSLIKVALLGCVLALSACGGGSDDNETSARTQHQPFVPAQLPVSPELTPAR